MDVLTIVLVSASLLVNLLVLKQVKTLKDEAPIQNPEPLPEVITTHSNGVAPDEFHIEFPQPDPNFNWRTPKPWQ